jgi:parallel beta-helix repeat protein
MKKFYTLILSAAIFNGTISATTYTVNSLATTNTGSGNSGTLFYCISQANMSSGPHLINFSVAGTIAINASPAVLPTLVQGITIDGTTAPGYSGTPVVILNGTGLTGGNGITITSPDCKIYGLDITNFPYRGMLINGDAADNFIIGANAKGNVIRNNGYYGIEISGADNGKIAYNKIGVDPTGMTCQPNQYDGIDMNFGAMNDSIIGNQVSCNGYNGIQLDASSNNVIQGNLIGPLLNQCTGSGYRGIDIENGSSGNKVGGSNPSEYNKIAGNLYWGIEVKTANTINNILSGNSYSCNDYGAIEVNTGGNNNIAPPVITTANTSAIVGTATANAVIELFKGQQTNSALCPSTPLNQGVDFIGTTTADALGNWAFAGSYSGYVVVTQRDPAGNTSEFSASTFTGVTGTLINSCGGNILTSVIESNGCQFQLYPSPTCGAITLASKSLAGKMTVDVYNSTGTLVWSTSLDDFNQEFKLDLPKYLSSGIYLLSVKSEQGNSVARFVFEK